MFPAGFDELPFQQPIPAFTASIDVNAGVFVFNRDWWRILRGLFAYLDQDAIWAGTPAEIALARERVREIMAIEADENMGIEDVRINNGRLEALIDGVWVDKGEVGIPGSPGADGQNAPIPIYAFRQVGNQVFLDIDSDRDTDIDATSPNLRGADGVNGQDGLPGAPGADGQNAPIPVFAWRSVGNEHFLDIDVDASGGVDVSSPNLRGLQGLQGQPGPKGDQGQIGVASVSAVSLPSGSNPTATLVNQHLELGIPRGDQGEQGASGNSWIPETAIANGRENACAAAQGTTDWLIAKFNTFLDEVDLYAQQAKSLADAVFAIASLGTYEVTPIDNILNAIFAFSSVARNDVRTEINDPDYKDAIVCGMFCKSVGVNPMEMTEALYNSWLNEDVGDTGWLFGEDFGNFIRDVIGWTNFKTRYFIHLSETSSLCDAGLCQDCPPEVTGDWSHVFDFAINNGGFYPQSPVWAETHWTTGVGWESGTSQSGDTCRQGAVIIKDFSAREIVRLRLTVDRSHGTADPADPNSLEQIRLQSGDTILFTADFGNPQELVHVYEYVGNVASVNRLRVVSVYNGVPCANNGGYVNIKKLEVWGLGTKPSEFT